MKAAIEYTLDLVSAGEFDILSDKIIVSDPGHEKGKWCQVFVKNILPGKWHGYVAYEQSQDASDKIVSRLVALSGKLDPEKLEDPRWRILEGEVDVDTGCAGIFDEKYYNDPAILNDQYYNDSVKIGWQGPDLGGNVWQNLALGQSKTPALCGTMAYGIAASSGNGNGGYPVSVLQDEDSAIVGIRIDFVLPKDFSDMNTKGFHEY